MDLDAVRAKLLKKYGAAKVDSELLSHIPYGISTQSLQLDLAIGRPGVPAGRVVQILGIDGVGKSTIVHHLCAEALLLDGYVISLDAEQAIDESRAYHMGFDVNSERVLSLMPYTLEELFGMAGMAIKEVASVRESPDIPILVAIDSLDGLPTMAQREREDAEDKFVAAASRVINDHLPALLLTASQEKATMVFVSQLTTKFGGGWRPGFAGPEYDTRGGLGIKYRASLRIQVKRGPFLGDSKDDRPGFTNKIEIIKNKVAPPFKKCEYDMLFESGIDKYSDLFEAGQVIRLISGGGGGRYTVKLKKAEHHIYKKEWPKLVDDQGGPDKFRKRMTRTAIRRGFLKPYGQVAEQPPAESEAEKDPS